MPRFFIPKEQLSVITGSDAHHIRDVLRLKAGDELELLDGSGKVYQAAIEKISKDKVTCKIISEKTEDTEPQVKVTIAQALPKAKKMDLIIQKCTELGAEKIIPMSTERAIGKEAKIERWQKIAKEAAQQCGRTIIPEIAPLAKFEEVLKLATQFDLALVPWELEKDKTLKEALKSEEPSRPKRRDLVAGSRIMALVGPEGGFSQAEIESAVKAGFTPISLGKRILRTETAGMAILAMINYEFEL